MKLKLILFFSLCISFSLSAQLGDSKKIINIIDIDSSFHPKAKISIKFTPNRGISNNTANRPTLYNIPLTDFFKKSSGIDMTAKSTLLKPTWDIKQTFKEGQKDNSKFSRDQYLGDIKTKTKFIRIKCRDHEYVDGDRIRLLLNKAVIHPNITLTGSYYIIDIELADGFNTIEFEALNEGLSSPNTAELKIYDENNVLISSNRWLLNTGYKARIIILKE